MPLHLPFDPFHGRHHPAPSEETSCSTCSGWPSSRTPTAPPKKSRWRWRTIRGTDHVRRHSPGFLGRCDGTDPSIRPRRNPGLPPRQGDPREASTIRRFVTSKKNGGDGGISSDDPKRWLHFSDMAVIDASPARCTWPKYERRTTTRDR